MTKTPPVARNLREGSFRAVQDYSLGAAPCSLVKVSGSTDLPTPDVVSRFYRVPSSIAGSAHETVTIDGPPSGLGIAELVSICAGSGGDGGDLFVMALYPEGGAAGTFEMHAMRRNAGPQNQWNGVDVSNTDAASILSGAHSGCAGVTIIYGRSELARGNLDLFFINTMGSSDVKAWVLSKFGSTPA